MNDNAGRECALNTPSSGGGTSVEPSLNTMLSNRNAYLVK
jgi:hypothetical protein